MLLKNGTSIAFYHKFIDTILRGLLLHDYSKCRLVVELTLLTKYLFTLKLSKNDNLIVALA